MSHPLLLIDLSSLCHPIWHMAASDPDPNATSIQTVARVRALATDQPHVAVCYDTGKSFRHDVDPTYKAQRPVAEATLHHQIALALETLRGDGFPCWGVKGYEADDVLASATIAALNTDGPHSGVQIVSSDKDILQLVNADVTAKSLRDGSVIDVQAVVDKFGVLPEQMRDYLSLVGDASDNIIGAKGIGPKGAAKLLLEFGTLDSLYEHIDGNKAAITPAMMLSLRELRTRLPIVRELLTLKTDVPVPLAEAFQPRVPKDADVAVFDGLSDDIEESMPTLPAPPSIPLVIGPDHSDLKRETSRVDAPVTAAPIPASTPPPVEWSPRVPAVQEPEVVSLAPLEWERQLEPRTMREAWMLASEMFKSRLWSAYGTPQGVMSTILAGRELGLQAMASLRGFHIIDSKPTLSADLIRALILKSGRAKYFRCMERSAERSTWETQRGDDPPISLTITIQEGRAAFVGDDRKWAASGWGKNPADMLVARASSKLARLVYPDVVFNLYDPTEFD